MLNIRMFVLALLLVAPAVLARRRGGHHRHHGGRHSRIRFFVPNSATNDTQCVEESSTATITVGIPGLNNTALDSLNIGDSLSVCIQKRRFWCENNDGDAEEVDIGGFGRGLMRRVKEAVRGLIGSMSGEQLCNRWEYVTGTVSKAWRPNPREGEDGVDLDVERVAAFLMDDDFSEELDKDDIIQLLQGEEDDNEQQSEFSV